MSEDDSEGVLLVLAREWAELDQVLTFWQVQAPLAIAPVEQQLRRAARYIIGGWSERLIASSDKTEFGIGDDADGLLEKGRLSLLNAKHDAFDAILSHMIEFLGDCEKRSSLPELILHYPNYIELKRRIGECVSVLSGTRTKLATREDVYRSKVEPAMHFFASEYSTLVDAVERAVQSRKTMESRVLVSRRFFGFLNLFAVITGAASLVSVPLAIWLWVNSPASFCEEQETIFWSYFCD